MPLNTRLRGTPAAPVLDLPPPFRLVTLREMGDAFAHAQQAAAEQGAGTLVFVGRFDLAEFAVVLEPEEPLRSARKAFYAAMNALTDALIALAPPEAQIVIEWPDAIYVNGGLVGGGRLAHPPDTDEEAPPSWLVFGGMVRTGAMTTEPGQFPQQTTLQEEGFAGVDSAALVESFARHLMAGIDIWQRDGFASLAREYLARLAPEKGVRRDIDENGDLLVRRIANGKTERRALIPALANASWYDAEQRGPR
jgi:biotin-(acetyl-CoA carboxylase) ligase